LLPNAFSQAQNAPKIHDGWGSEPDPLLDLGEGKEKEGEEGGIGKLTLRPWRRIDVHAFLELTIAAKNGITLNVFTVQNHSRCLTNYVKVFSHLSQLIRLPASK